MSALRVAFVLWDGLLFGGAETATIALCGELRRSGVDAAVVFVGDAGVYTPSLLDAGVPHVSCGLPVGSAALRAPRRFAASVMRGGADIAVLPGTGFLATALRLGGYRGGLVAVEHGGMLQHLGRTRVGRVRDGLDRRVATPLLDAQVAVSDFLLGVLLRGPHARMVVRIHNGVDSSAYGSAALARQMRRSTDPAVVVGSAGKLMPGKGFEDLIAAAAKLDAGLALRVEIAGDGVLRERLVSQARESGITDRVVFRGWLADMPGFWAGCDVAVAASNGCVESFGMVVAEAMASGIPAIVSRSGGLPEVLGERGAGVVYDPGDVEALAAALEHYVSDASARSAAGASALTRAGELSIESAAVAYAELLESVHAKRRGEP